MCAVEAEGILKAEGGTSKHEYCVQLLQQLADLELGWVTRPAETAAFRMVTLAFSLQSAGMVRAHITF